jgi:branched-chain amino acid aminotransferase
LPYAFDTAALIDATYEVLKQNNLGDAYIRPVVYAPANMSFARNTESYVFIEAWEMAPFLGDKLLRIATSSFQRPNPKAFKIHAKAAGHYVNSILASQEAKDNGFDEAFLLDMNDCLAEGPGANVFFEKDGVLYTPQPGHILAGITRATVLELSQALNIEVKEGAFTLADIKQADAAFFCGTAAEVIGWASLDAYTFPKAWEQTSSYQIQQAYKQLVVKPLVQ